MPRIVSIEEFYPTSPLSPSDSLLSILPSYDFPLPALLSSVFPRFSSQCFFFSLPLSLSIPGSHASLLAKARLAQLWFLASPLRLEQTWTVPRWARTQLAGSVRGWLWWSMDGYGWMVRWMDGWMDGWIAEHGLLACTLIFVCWCHALVTLSSSLCWLALTTVVFPAESVSPKLVHLSHRKYLPLLLFPFPVS